MLSNCYHENVIMVLGKKHIHSLKKLYPINFFREFDIVFHTPYLAIPNASFVNSPSSIMSLF